MSDKEKLSPAELCALAHKTSDRVLVVHCGYCKDESGKVDRQHPLGWLAYQRPTSKRVPGWFVFDIATGKPRQQIIKCPRCGRWLNVWRGQIDELYLEQYPNDKRTTLKKIANRVLKNPRNLTRADLEGLQLMNDETLLAQVLESYRDELETAETVGEDQREDAEYNLRMLAELTGKDEYYYLDDPANRNM
jgi:hypothetical protein